MLCSFLLLEVKMKIYLAVICAVIGTVYSRSLSVQQASDISVDIDTLNGNPVPLIREARQFSGGYGNERFGAGDGYNDFDYNPYNDSPINYDGNPFNDRTHRQLYNNFDQNPYNDSPNKYDDNYFRRRFNL